MDKRRKIGKANERKRKVKRGKDEEVNGQGGIGVPRHHTGPGSEVSWYVATGIVMGLGLLWPT